MNPRLQQTLCAGLQRSGVLAGARWWHRRQALILTYHGVREVSTHRRQREALTAEMFERQIAYIARSYHVVTLAELVRKLSAKEKLPPYTLAITLEDGIRSHVTIAARILQKYRLPATIFLTTAFIGAPQHGLWTERVDWLLQSAHAASFDFDFDGDARSLALATMRDRIIASDALRGYLKKLPLSQREANIARLAEKIGGEGEPPLPGCEQDGYVSWEELRALKSACIDFGSHTHTRALMSTLSPAEAFYELAASQRLIQAELDCACEFFSYPSDARRETSAQDRDLFRKLGFKAALRQGRGFNTSRTDRYALRRVHVTRCPDFNVFLAKITGAWFLLRKLQGNF
jgi:peptidoglycan/xylan/chitin deacetylase (PgdA/CDA1 family)